jgi:Ser/Thr protein kinase RdoA (MazF antagonist)
VCLGAFNPRVAYWHHGESMTQIILLSWSGTRLQHAINDENPKLFHRERDKVLIMLRLHGVVHSDIEWRNMLWDGLGGRLVVIDLEDVK